MIAVFISAFVMSYARGAELGIGRLPIPRGSETVALHDGSIASIGADGLVQVFSKDKNGRSRVTYRTIPIPNKNSEVSLTGGLPDKARLTAELSKEPPTTPYASGRIIVIFRDGVHASTDSL
ncbi:MAG: hypothetical protein M3Z14_03035, partial [Candidatus Eremiobacteraeota bacterium]|nr:hypothetical protein [Candidatus Eremiobacteraeota bacterium]